MMAVLQCNATPYTLSFDSAARQIQLINQSFKFGKKSEKTLPVFSTTFRLFYAHQWPALKNRKFLF